MSQSRVAALGGALMVRDASGAGKGTVTPDPNGKRWRYADVTWTFMTAPTMVGP